MSMQVTNSNSHRNLKAVTSITGDALAWGALGGTVGGGIELASQRKILKNPVRVISEINDITGSLLSKDLKPSKRKSLTHALDCLQKGKINYKNIAKTAFKHGFWGWAIPTLILNAVIFSVQEGYHKIKHNK